MEIIATIGDAVAAETGAADGLTETVQDGRPVLTDPAIIGIGRRLRNDNDGVENLDRDRALVRRRNPANRNIREKMLPIRRKPKKTRRNRRNFLKRPKTNSTARKLALKNLWSIINRTNQWKKKI